MREHALPQDVTGYRFHIIGNMTLKQFAEVAIGCVIGFFIYTTNLPFVIKWPLIAFFAGLGAALAFLPIGERPMDQWLLVFVRALYRPTQFYWKRTSRVPDAFTYAPKSPVQNLGPEVDFKPIKRQRVKEYLSSIDTQGPIDPLEQYNDQRLQEVMGVFSTPGAAVTPVAQLPVQNIQIQTQPPTQAAVQEQAEVVVQNLPPTDVNIQIKSNTPTVPQASIANVFVDMPETVSQVTPATTPKQIAQSTTSQYSSVAVPESQGVSVASTVQEQTPSVDTSIPAPETLNTFIDPSQVQQPQAPIPAQPTTEIVQNAQLPFPDPPTEANKVVGMVLDAKRSPLSNTIVEILTPEGFPARAVKTNPLGQFFITTPLGEGTYVIQAEKEGLQFTPQQLIINNQIIQPIELTAVN